MVGLRVLSLSLSLCFLFLSFLSFHNTIQAFIQNKLKSSFVSRECNNNSNKIFVVTQVPFRPLFGYKIQEGCNREVVIKYNKLITSITYGVFVCLSCGNFITYLQ
jgi:hypothetical protein